jgi:AraC-like DNA-binding protein
MTRLLDTDTLPWHERVDAIHEAMRATTPPCRLVHENVSGQLRARIDLWEFGRVTLWRNESSGLRMIRTERHIRQETPEVVALGLQLFGPATIAQPHSKTALGSGDLLASDLTVPYEYATSPASAASALSIPYDVLGLPVDVVRRAAPRLRSSSMYGLVAGHVLWLTRNADLLCSDAGAAALGSASLELVRALLVSAAHDPARTRQVMAETLLTRIRAHVRAHLRDTDLTPASIAMAHNISPRQLYRLCAEAGFSLEQWIIDLRLERAKEELRRTTGGATIAAVAYSSGFTDPAHFGRRFRAKYGMTPRDWRRSADHGRPPA